MPDVNVIKSLFLYYGHFLCILVFYFMEIQGSLLQKCRENVSNMEIHSFITFVLGVNVIQLLIFVSQTFSPYFHILFYWDIRIRFPFYGNTEKMFVIQNMEFYSIVACVNGIKLLIFVFFRHFLHISVFYFIEIEGSVFHYTEIQSLITMLANSLFPSI